MVYVNNKGELIQVINNGHIIRKNISPFFSKRGKFFWKGNQFKK